MEEQNKLAKDYVEKLIEYLVESEVRKPPYITIVSKRQLFYGNGRWSKATDSKLAKGLTKFLGIRIPSDTEIESKNLLYGYDALHKPWAYLNNVANYSIRQRILWQVIDGGKYSDIRPILGMGYIQKDGSLNPEYTKGISCYVFFLADKSYRDDQNNWIRNQPDWVQHQILRNQSTHRKLLEGKIKQATKLVKNNRKLLALKEYMELEVPIDRAKISWIDE